MGLKVSCDTLSFTSCYPRPRQKSATWCRPRIPMRWSRVQIGPNLQSAKDHGSAVDANIHDEVNIGRRKGPFTSVPFNYFFSNPLGVVFKKGKSKPRVIHHLSWPRTASKTSVNASITDFEVKLDAFDRAVKAMRILGRNCVMSKIDVESAYRCIPVRPLDWPLLAFSGRMPSTLTSSCSLLSHLQQPSSNGTLLQLNISQNDR